MSDTMAGSRTRLGLSAFAIFAFAFAFGSNGVRYLVGLPAFFVLAVLLVAAALAVFLRLNPPRYRWYRLPAPIYWFLALAALSILWSAYRFESLLGVFAQLLTTVAGVVFAFVLSWHELLRTLASAMRWLLGISLAFELWVSIFVRDPVTAWWIEQPPEGPLNILYWSRDLLFSGGPIQGIVGNSVMLGFIALLGLILFGVQLRAGLVRPVFGWFWVVFAALAILLTRSATVWVALAAVLLALAFALWARRTPQHRRMPLYGILALALAAGTAIALFARDLLFGLMGKNGDLTGRVETWGKVWQLIEERPWFGWGWVSYWPTWVEPFESLDSKAGIAVMSAHNAWLDVWLQLGAIGLLVFAPLVLLTLQRSWFRAVDQPRRGPGPALPYATSALWPFLVMVALIVQSITESRMLIESGWLLLIMLAVKTRYDFELPASTTEPTKLPWREVPIPRGTAVALAAPRRRDEPIANDIDTGLG